MRILVAVALLLASVGARAEDVERSRAHYAAGVSYFDAGEYARALGEFENAARYSPRPEFEFNIARCHEMMGEAEQAIARFKHYLELRPKARDRVEVQERMARLQKRIDEQRAGKPPPPIATSRPPVEERPRELTPPPPSPPPIAPATPATTPPPPIAPRPPVEERPREPTTTIAPAPATAPATPRPVDAPKKKSRVGLKVGVGIGVAVLIGGAVALGVVLGTRPDPVDYWVTARNSCVAPCSVQDLH